jgi:hypothetical protein
MTELERIKANLTDAVAHHSNHWIEDCRMLVHLVEERLGAVIIHWPDGRTITVPVYPGDRIEIGKE